MEVLGISIGLLCIVFCVAFQCIDMTSCVKSALAQLSFTNALLAKGESVHVHVDEYEDAYTFASEIQTAAVLYGQPLLPILNYGPWKMPARTVRALRHRLQLDTDPRKSSNSQRAILLLTSCSAALLVARVPDVLTRAHIIVVGSRIGLPLELQKAPTVSYIV